MYKIRNGVIRWLMSTSMNNAFTTFASSHHFPDIKYFQKFFDLEDIGQGVLGQKIPGQNKPGQNIPGRNIPGQNIPDKIYLDKTYRTKYTGQNVPGQNITNNI